MTHTFKRALFEVLQGADHLDDRELPAQTGQPMPNLVLRKLEGKGD